MTGRSTNHGRNMRGQALAEGTAALVLFTPLLIGGLVLLLACGTMMYYKIKIANIADAGARQAVQGRYWLGAQRPDYNAAEVEQRVKSTVETLLANSGLPSKASITVDQSSSTICTVKITVGALPIISCGFLPNVVTLSDTACEPYAMDKPIAVFGLGYPGHPFGGGMGGGVYFPSYGAAWGEPGPTSFPSGNFPYWQLNLPNIGLWNGPRQNWASGPSFSSY